MSKGTWQEVRGRAAYRGGGSSGDARYGVDPEGRAAHARTLHPMTRCFTSTKERPGQRQVCHGAKRQDATHASKKASRSSNTVSAKSASSHSCLLNSCWTRCWAPSSSSARPAHSSLMTSMELPSSRFRSRMSLSVAWKSVSSNSRQTGLLVQGSNATGESLMP